jgi:cell division protein FtsW (lipid II flippase)
MSKIDWIEGRLLKLAALFLFFYSAALSLSPAVRLRSWQAEYRWDHWLGFAIWLVCFWLAHRQARRWLPGRDPYLLPAVGLLSGWGMLMVWRLLPTFGMRQALWLALSLGVLVLGMRLPSDLGFLRRYKYLWLTGSLVLTACTLLFGVNPLGYGPRMWLGCCGVYLQPSEPLKLLLIAYLAAYMADQQPFLVLASQSVRAKAVDPLDLSMPLIALLAPTLIMTGLALAVLVVQRDLGTAAIFLFLYAAIVYVTSGRKRVLVFSLLALGAAGAIGYVLYDVVRLRVDAWLNPWLDPSGRSYQIVQSLIAVANGGWLGRGPGLGNPSLVPLSHSDLVFAAIAEEFGLAGVVGLLLLVGLLAARGLEAALSATDHYRRYLAAGLTAYLVGQSLLIMGGNLRLLPLTGVTLPFVSYGGSSLLTSMVVLLLLLHASNRLESLPATLHRPRLYLQLGGFLFAGLASVALVSGWWTFVRGSALLARTDNQRRTLADRFVRRGAILDRQNQPINSSIGETGDYVRRYLYPALSATAGYTDPAYGQSGLEASLDNTLRGIQGNPSWIVWWNQILYGQPPPGLDVRLSLDLGLQRLADNLLDGQRAALVALDANSGEVLAMASHPTFDANRLAEQWETLVNDPEAPLFNRASQGRYPIGDFQSGLFPQDMAKMGVEPLPALQLPSGAPLAEGEGQPGYSPLQMALAAAAISNAGVRPPPYLVTAVNLPQAGWRIIQPLSEPFQALTSDEATLIASQNIPSSSVGLSIWQKVSVIKLDSGKAFTWYLGGTIAAQEGKPYAVALLLEEDNPDLAVQIGQVVLKRLLFPE